MCPEPGGSMHRRLRPDSVHLHRVATPLVCIDSASKACRSSALSQSRSSGVGHTMYERT